MWVLASSEAANVACLAVFDPDANSALSRQLEIELFVLCVCVTHAQLVTGAVSREPLQIET